jgi:hypothetical protein
VVFSRVNRAFVRSYVVKNAPAVACQTVFFDISRKECEM